MYFTQEEIFDYMYPTSGADRNYYMKSNDMLTISVKSTSTLLGGKYLRAFTRLHEQPIVVNYSGLVGNTTGKINE